MIELYSPKLEDLWFRQMFRSVYKELHADRETGC